MQSVKKIFAISKNGRHYLVNKFPNFKDKICLSYLGVFDNGINPFIPQSPFTIVSCSSLISLKRVHLIIEILKHITFPVNWIHFGDGELKDKLLKETKSIPNTISIQFKGHVNNDELINFYKNTQVHLFITTSETEGLPVSLQEAISFGIPAVATNVGGIPEIINENTGLLIEKDFNAEHVAKLIMEFEVSEKNTLEFRNNVRAYWENKFNASANYADFYYQLTRN
jgi:glycosyltransferase involved in cell wall biosynthesis